MKSLGYFYLGPCFCLDTPGKDSALAVTHPHDLLKQTQEAPGGVADHSMSRAWMITTESSPRLAAAVIPALLQRKP